MKDLCYFTFKMIMVEEDGGHLCYFTFKMIMVEEDEGLMLLYI